MEWKCKAVCHAFSLTRDPARLVCSHPGDDASRLQSQALGGDMQTVNCYANPNLGTRHVLTKLLSKLDKCHSGGHQLSKPLLLYRGLVNVSEVLRKHRP